jgi:hypothetical protein
LFNRLAWEVGGANLLCDSTSLAALHVCRSNLIQQLRLTRIDVSCCV